MILLFINDTAPTEIYTLPYTTLFRSQRFQELQPLVGGAGAGDLVDHGVKVGDVRSAGAEVGETRVLRDRKSTRLNSSHPSISYAVFCLKKKNKYNTCHNNMYTHIQHS